MSKRHHPSRWSPQVLEVISPIISGWGLPVHDPFAGTGERLGSLCDSLGVPFTGCEIEPEFIIDRRVWSGDSRSGDSYPHWYRYCVVTSPVYPNGMTDHFKPRDDSRRITYRQVLASILGHDRPLNLGNMGRYGPRQGKKSAGTYWQLADECIDHWPTQVVVNVSDCIHNREVYPVVEQWEKLLIDHGYYIRAQRVETPRMRYGANGNLRVESEAVITAVWLRTMGS